VELRKSVGQGRSLIPHQSWTGGVSWPEVLLAQDWCGTVRTERRPSLPVGHASR
jgi:hypothetical protein